MRVTEKCLKYSPHWLSACFAMVLATSNAATCMEFDVNEILFSNVTPTRYLWVSPTGNNANSGSESAPLRSIQTALDKATPGTAVMVKAGTYDGNVRFYNSGTPDAPIQLVSADGAGKATIRATDQSVSTVKGLGVHDIVVKGFTVDGASNSNGIQFSQQGSDFSKLVKNVVIRDNTVLSSGQDSIKISQADKIWVVNNHTKGSGGQGIDFVATNDSVLAYNHIEGVTSDNALTVKGGSTRVLVEGNLVHDADVDAIKIGGWTGVEFFRPGYDTYEAKDIQVIGNEVHSVGQRALMFIGAQNAVATNNFLHPENSYGATVELARSSMYHDVFNTKNITLKDNVFETTNWLRVNSGQGEGLVNTSNDTDGVWSGTAGSMPTSPTPTPTPTPAPTPSTGSVGTSGADNLAGTTGNDTLSGLGGNDTISGQAGDDLIKGGSGNDVLDGGTGYDTLDLSDGTAAVKVDLLAKTVTGGTGSDSVTMFERVVGSGFNDTMSGDDATNVLLGGAGSDRLVGRGGDDKLFGEAGADTFVVDKLGTGTDRVVDFKAIEDKIDLTPMIDVLKAAGKTLPANGLSFVQVGTSTEVRVDVDGPTGAGASQTVLTLDNVTSSALKVGTNVIAPGLGTTTTPTTGGTATNTITVNAHSNLAGGVGGHFKVLVDGKQIGEATANTTTSQPYTFKASLTQDAAHKIQVQYDNDAVVNGVDRNLHIKGIAVDGKAMASTATGVTYDKYALDGQDVIPGQTGMWWNGTLTFNPTKDYFHASAPVASAAPAEAGSVDLWNHVAMQQAPAVSAEAVAAQATTFDAAALNALHADPLFDQHDLSGTNAG